MAEDAGVGVRYPRASPRQRIAAHVGQANGFGPGVERGAFPRQIALLDHAGDHVGERRAVDPGSPDQIGLGQALVGEGGGQHRILTLGQAGADLLAVNIEGELERPMQQVTGRTRQRRYRRLIGLGHSSPFASAAREIVRPPLTPGSRRFDDNAPLGDYCCVSAMAAAASSALASFSIIGTWVAAKAKLMMRSPGMRNSTQVASG